ncbi:hypothetical protein PCAR4_150101 [Paraburkholderia caribensis]|nr:hypothetical protein PCAR4_150101 [Paraburkholderia caribensis]
MGEGCIHHVPRGTVLMLTTVAGRFTQYAPLLAVSFGLCCGVIFPRYRENLPPKKVGVFP